MAALDLNKLAATAADAYLQAAKQQSNGHVEAKLKHSRLSKGAGVAVGVGLTVAARAAYRRARGLDLEQVGTALENKLKS
jgi:hypothetical protein